PKHVDLLIGAIRPDLQGSGADALLITELAATFIQNGILSAESNPELEENLRVQGHWKHFHARQHKRRRCFIKHLSQAQHGEGRAVVQAAGAGQGWGLPVLGICLGAQLLAAGLGARVTRGVEEEVGFGEVTLTDEGCRDPVLGRGPRSIPVFHYHGDAFDLPRGAVLLAASPSYPNQAYRFGDRVYGFQFHAEVDRGLLDAWTPILPAGTSIDPSLHAEAERAGRRVLGSFFRTKNRPHARGPVRARDVSVSGPN